MTMGDKLKPEFDGFEFDVGDIAGREVSVVYGHTTASLENNGRLGTVVGIVSSFDPKQIGKSWNDLGPLLNVRLSDGETLHLWRDEIRLNGREWYPIRLLDY